MRALRGLARAWLPCVVSYVVLVLLFFAQYLNEERLTARVSVEPGAPAERAGVRDGDLVVEANGERIHSFQDLTQAKSPVRLVLERGGQRKEVDVERNEQGRLGLRASGETAAAPALEALARALLAPLRWIAISLTGNGGPLLIAQPSAGALRWLALVAVDGALVWPFTIVVSVVITAVSFRRRARGTEFTPSSQ